MATLGHLSGVPIVEAATWLGHSPTEHLRTYAHATLVERAELDYYAAPLDSERGTLTDTAHDAIHTTSFSGGSA